MIGKRLLNIVSLLFVGRALAVQLRSCDAVKESAFDPTICSGSNAVISYCIHTDNKIYEVTNRNPTEFACNELPVGEGIKVFEGDNGVNLETGTVSIDSNLAMYVCGNDSVCVKTIGYAKISSGYFKIEESGGAGTSGSGAVENGGDCSASSTNGKYDTINNVVCLDGASKKAGFSSPGNYILSTTDTGSIFGIPEGKDGIVLTATSNVIYYNKLFTQTDYCVDATTKKIDVRTSQICGTSGCENYFTCTAGVCEDTTSDDYGVCTSQPQPTCNLSVPSTCGAGYYLAGAGPSLVTEIDGTPKDLYHCNGSTRCDKITENIPIGYLVNSDAINNANIPFINCYKDGGEIKCIPINVTAVECSEAGTLFKTASGPVTYNICLDGSHSATKATQAESYLMNAVNTLGVVETKANNFVIIDIDTDGNITVPLKNPQNDKKYKFANAEKRIITEDSLDIDTYCPSGLSSLTEYKLNKCTDDGVADEDSVYYYKATAL